MRAIMMSAALLLMSAPPAWSQKHGESREPAPQTLETASGQHDGAQHEDELRDGADQDSRSTVQQWRLKGAMPMTFKGPLPKAD
jgi:hypothetical protein